MKRLKKLLVIITILSIVGVAVCGCAVSKKEEESFLYTTQPTETSTDEGQVAVEEKITVPKYVFLFIGDGMGYPQLQTTCYAVGRDEKLPFMTFPFVGNMTTHNSESAITDSASAITAMLTGHKTSHGTLNMNEKGTKTYKTIAEYFRDELDYKIGVITTASLNHATPAGTYAHQNSRKNYYQIGKNLIDSGFDFFAGGGFTDSKGKNGGNTSLYTLAKSKGYTIVKRRNQYEQLNSDTGKVIMLSENRVDDEYMPYDMDLEDGEWTLSDYVSKGIEMLDNKNGFFMLVEGAKIDLSNHENDAATMIRETMALSNSVNEAIEFYNEHPDETLIIVTADHESGGLTVGYSLTKYETDLDVLLNQKISFSKFKTDYLERYKKGNITFEEILSDIKENYGFTPDEDETEQLRRAYIRSLQVGAMPSSELTKQEYINYGTYEPFSIVLSRIMNHRAGVDYTTYSHTGMSVPVYALGVGGEKFNGSYDNTDIFSKLCEIMELK